jgi:hypothetical protein
VADGNAGALTLNQSYNGTSITDLLNTDQNLPNQTADNTDFYFKVLIQCRVTNLDAFTTYLNTAIGKGTIGNSANNSFINISDSSNDGNASAVDPNNNGNAGEFGENNPTQFISGILPVHFLNVTASQSNKNTASVKWMVATPILNADKFEVEYSTDGRNWIQLIQMKITQPNQGNYQFTHEHIPPGNLYYRVKQVDKNGSWIYSRIVLLHNKLDETGYVIFPNPSRNYIQVTAPYFSNGKTNIEMYDATGRKIKSKRMISSIEEINTEDLPNGTYFLKLIHNDEIKTHKVLIVH